MEMRLGPCTGGQRCESFSLEHRSRGERSRSYVDRFGNSVHHFDVLEPHDRARGPARSEVWTAGASSRRTPLSPLDRPTPGRPPRYAPLDGAARATSHRGAAGRDTRRWPRVMSMRDAITYEPGTTSVNTTADEALAAAAACARTSPT